ncbi:hypothetical protein [Saccharospirillum mangrovi]|uniref:hypothetical protein n=1 Tax=Saccharospirillum mangrovi TaxID=2161747 RepID=UPI0013005C6A|nr:hypothetical protein [Saccharospirillum mangrovi]
MEHQHYPNWLIHLLVASVLAGCSGGTPPGSDNKPRPDSNPVPDPDPETFTLSGTITGLVNESLKLSNNGTETLPVAGVQFVFQTPLEDGDVYNIAIAQQPDDQLCQVINGSGTISSTQIDNIEVHCSSWRPEIETVSNVEFPLSDIAEPQLTMNNKGHAIAAWQVKNDQGTIDNHDSIWVNQFQLKSGWETVRRLSQNGPTGDAVGHANFPAIGIDGYGNGLAVWRQEQSDGSAAIRVDAAHFSGSDRQWHPDAPISDLQYNAYDLALAMNAAGQAMAAWRQASLVSRDALVSREYLSKMAGECVVGEEGCNNSGWAESDSVEINSRLRNMKLAMDSTGNVLAVWQNADVADRIQIHANQFSANSKEWQTEIVLDEGVYTNVEYSGYAHTIGHPQVAINTHGQAVAVWEMPEADPDTGRVTINIKASLFADGAWSEPQRLETDNRGHAERPQVGLDDSGQAYAVWQQFDGSRTDIWLSQYSPDTQEWAEPIKLELDDSSTYASSPQLAVQSNGDAIAIWQSNTGIWTSVYSPRGGCWCHSTLIENNSVSSPTIAMDDNGHALAIWVQISDGVRSLQSLQFH